MFLESIIFYVGAFIIGGFTAVFVESLLDQKYDGIRYLITPVVVLLLLFSVQPPLDSSSVNFHYVETSMFDHNYVNTDVPANQWIIKPPWVTTSQHRVSEIFFPKRHGTYDDYHYAFIFADGVTGNYVLAPIIYTIDLNNHMRVSDTVWDNTKNEDIIATEYEKTIKKYYSPMTSEQFYSLFNGGNTDQIENEMTLDLQSRLKPYGISLFNPQWGRLNPVMQYIYIDNAHINDVYYDKYRNP